MNAPINPEVILSAVVDRMATIKAQIAALKDEENELRDARIDAAFDAVTAAINKATYTKGQTAKVEPRNRGQMHLEGL